MSLLRRSSAKPAKTLYTSVLITTLMILLVSFLVFKFISDEIQTTQVIPVYDHMDQLEIENARTHLQQGGKAELQEYMLSLDRIFNGIHSFLDANGKDLLTGEDKSRYLPPPPATSRRGSFEGQGVLAHQSPDGLYWLLAVRPGDRPKPWIFLPYYFLLIGATGLLCWLVAIGVVSPLRKIAASIARFGRGDLQTRIELSREDEIGQLARSFNQMAERLELLVESERTLLSDISHELRSPLTRMKVAVKLARAGEDKTVSLDRIDRDIDRLTAILSDVVEITRVEGDPMLKETGWVSLQTIVESVVHDCDVEAKLKDCALIVDGEIKNQIRGNPELLRRAIENVLRNAIRHAPPRSLIYLSLNASKNNVTVCIRDHGPGVPEDFLARIFDPFFRVEKSRDAKTGGSGLGLSIAKRAISLHRGEIFARNASPGLSVTLKLPMHDVSSHN